MPLGGIFVSTLPHTLSPSPHLSQPPTPLLWLHFQGSSPHKAAGWPPADQEVLAFTILWLVRKERNEKEREKTSFRITPAKIPGVNLIGPA